MYNAATPLVQARVWRGEKAEIPLGISEDMYVTIPTGQYKRLQVSLDLNTSLRAPIAKNQLCGTLNVTLNNQIVASKPLIALDNSPEGNFLRRTTDAVKYNIHRLFSRSDEKLNTG